MKICQSCGAQCQDTARFCVNCGAPFEMMRSPGQTEPEKETIPDRYEYGGWQQGGDPNSQYSGWQQSGDPNSQYGGWQQSGDPNGHYGGWQDQYGGYGQYGPNYNRPAPQYNTFGIHRRSIALAVVFTIITFGIYGIYWMIRINDEVNQLADEPEATSGGLVFLFSLITFGIYSFYWLYKMGERCDVIRGEWNGSRSILYLILGLVGFSIISYALIQDVINKCLPMQA